MTKFFNWLLNEIDLLTATHWGPLSPDEVGNFTLERKDELLYVTPRAHH